MWKRPPPRSKPGTAASSQIKRKVEGKGAPFETGAPFPPSPLKLFFRSVWPVPAVGWRGVPSGTDRGWRFRCFSRCRNVCCAPENVRGRLSQERRPLTFSQMASGKARDRVRQRDEGVFCPQRPFFHGINLPGASAAGASARRTGGRTACRPQRDGGSLEPATGTIRPDRKRCFRGGERWRGGAQFCPPNAPSLSAKHHGPKSSTCRPGRRPRPERRGFPGYRAGHRPVWPGRCRSRCSRGPAGCAGRRAPDTGSDRGGIRP